MPRRALAILGFSAFAGALAAAWAGPQLSGTLALFAGALVFCALGTLLACRVAKRPALPRREELFQAVGIAALVCGAGALTLGSYWYNWQAQAEPVQELAGTEALVRMRILDDPEERYHRYYYPARVMRLDGRKTGEFSIRLSCGEPLYCEPYEFVEAQVTFYQFSGEGGLYSTRGTQLAKGNVLGAYLSGSGGARYPEDVYWPGRLAALARSRIGRGVSRFLPREEAGLVRAVLLGQRTGLSEEAYGNFSQIGASHLMAVSGLHMGILAAFVALIAKKLPLGRGGRFVFSSNALFLYLCLIGFPASAFRSGLMFFLYLLGQTIGRRTDSLNSLGGAVLVICLLRPFSGGDLGFALSVSSTAGMILLFRPIRRAIARALRPFPRLSRALRPLSASLAVTLSANAFSLPLQLEVFGGVSLVLLPANVLLVPLVTLLLYCALPFAGFAAFPSTEALARPFAVCTGWLARLILWLADRLAAIPGSFFRFGSGVWLAVLAGMALMGLWALSVRRRSAWAAAVCGVCLLVCTGVWLEWDARQGVVTLAVTGGQDSACVLVLKEGRGAALSLGSGRVTAQRLLGQEHITRLSSVFLPVRDQDAREAAVRIADSCTVDRLLLPQGAYAGKDLEKTGAPIGELRAGDRWQALPGVEAELSSDGQWLRFTANGRQADFHVTDRCELYVSCLGEPGSPEAAVLFREEGMPEREVFQGTEPGNYIILSGREGLFIRLMPDGRVRYETGG